LVKGLVAVLLGWVSATNASTTAQDDLLRFAATAGKKEGAAGGAAGRPWKRAKWSSGGNAHGIDFLTYHTDPAYCSDRQFRRTFRVPREIFAHF
jgi:hypothetical protein